MTRKRFIKLYMSYGYSRDHANYIADLALYKFGCYKTYHDSFEAKLDRGAVTLQKGLEDVWQTLNNLMSTMAEPLNQVMEAFEKMGRVLKDR